MRQTAILFATKHLTDSFLSICLLKFQILKTPIPYNIYMPWVKKEDLPTVRENKISSFEANTKLFICTHTHTREMKYCDYSDLHLLSDWYMTAVLSRYSSRHNISPSERRISRNVPFAISRYSVP